MTNSEADDKQSNGYKGCLIILGPVALIMIVIAVVAIWNMATKEIDLSAYPGTTDATLIHVTGGTKPTVEYTFTVDGKSYSDSTGLNPPSPANEYSEGDRVTVCYNPADPEDHVVNESDVACGEKE